MHPTPLRERYHAPWLSWAMLFHVGYWIIVVVISFAIAYGVEGLSFASLLLCFALLLIALQCRTGFWTKVLTYRDIPTMMYMHKFAYLITLQSGARLAWSTSEPFNVMASDTMRIPNTQLKVGLHLSLLTLTSFGRLLVLRSRRRRTLISTCGPTRFTSPRMCRCSRAKTS